MTTYTLIGSATDTQDNITFSTTSINVQVQNTWTNEPLGLTVVTDYDLVPVPIPVTQSEVALTNSWISIYNGRGLLKKDSDSTEPVTPPSVLRCDFPIGFTGGEGPGTLARSLPGFRRIYGGFSVKVLSPWQGHNTSVNKLSYFVVNGGSCPLVFYGPAPNGPYQLRAFPFQLAVGGIGPDQWWVPNLDKTPFTIGVWHTIEWLLDTTIGQLFWALDGKPQANYIGIPMPSIGFIEYHLDPVWGGANDTKRQNDTILFGHIKI